ncbi:MAG TPA: TrbI/VirB10 family protein [Candidatus Angelobacter sp.]|nr:TrbI/VirB10 family protein [Candidatus Angelobacter sp.]
MKQIAEKTTGNGQGQLEQVSPVQVTAKEGSQPPNPEPQKPFVLEKKPAGRDPWKAILIGTALVSVILIVALTQRYNTKSGVASAGTSSQQATKGQQKTDSGYGSTTPVNSAPNNSDQQTDGSKIGPGTIANTGKPHPPTTTATNLGEVPAFGNTATWQPAPYPGPAATDTLPQVEDKNEHDTLDKPSLVFIRNVSATAAQSRTQTEASEVGLGLGLPPGTRLRAHLESAVSTAVKTPVVAVIEYNYEHNGELLIPAGAKIVGQLQSADRSGYIGVHFDTLLLPDGTSMSIEAAATDLQLRPLRGKVQGKNTGKNILVRSLAGVGEAMATLVGQGSLNQPLNEADLLRGRVVSNIGQSSDQEVERLAVTERIVVSIPAGTEIYVVLEKQAKEPASAITTPRQALSNSSTTEQLRQLLELQKELNDGTAATNTNQ